MDDGIASGFSGQMYQVGVTMLFSVRAISKGYSKFSIRSEVKDAGAFDDLQFVAEHEVEYIQLKSKETDDMFITANQLFQQNPNKIVGDYNLLKYIISCMKIKEQLQIKNCLHKLKRAVVFTNISLDVNCTDSITQMKLRNIQGDAAQAFSTLGITEINVMEISLAENDILTFKDNNKAKYYKFNDSQVPTIIRSVAEKFRNQLLSKSNSGKNEYDKWLIDNFDQFTLDEIEKCLDKIIFACNQPNDEELFDVIKADFKEYCKVNSDEVFHKLKFNIEQWMKTKSGVFPGVINENVIEKFFQDNSKVVTFEVTDPISTFTGRELELENLYSLLHAKGSALVVQAKTAEISGLGGVGKTQLAKMYIKRYSKNYYGRAIWITAETTPLIETAFKKLGRKILNESNVDNLTTEEIIDRVVDYFKHYKVLFVFDNAETHPVDEANDHITYFRSLVSGQKSFQIHIVITSRDRQYAGNAPVFDLNMLNIVDAITLIKEQLPDTEEKDALNLANLLQCFPLALQQAISFIKIEKEKYMLNGKQYAIENYIKTFEENSQKLLHHKFKTDEGRTYAQTTRIIWMTTLNTIEQDEESGKTAVVALKIMAYLNPDFINYTIVKDILKKQFECSEDTTASAYLLLKRYSMITDYIGNIFQMHRLVQETMRNQLSENGDEESILDQLLYYSSQSYSSLSGGSYYFVSHVTKYKNLLEKFDESGLIFNYQTLYDACEAGNVKLVKFLLENHKLKNDLDSVVERLWTTIIFKNDVNMIQLWIDNIRDVNKIFNFYGLYDILRLGNDKLIELCIENGAHINVMNTYGRTYLHRAAEDGNIQVVKTLLNPKWFQMTKKKVEKQFLSSSDIFKKVDETKSILKAKNLTRVKDIYEHCVNSRESVKEIELLELLIEDNFNIDTLCFNGYSAFYDAYRNDHLEIMQTLLEHGTNINKMSNTEILSLQDLFNIGLYDKFKKEVYRYRYQVVKCFVQLGINLKQEYRSGDTILQTVLESIGKNIFKYNYEVLNEVIQCMSSNDSSFDAQNYLGETLLYAAKINDINIIKYLIENGAKIVTDNLGNTALHIAYLHGTVSVAKILHEKVKTDWNATNSKGQTYLHLALMSYVIFIVKNLQATLEHKEIDVVRKSISIISENSLDEIDDNQLKQLMNDLYVEDFIRNLSKWTKTDQTTEIIFEDFIQLIKKGYFSTKNCNNFLILSEMSVEAKLEFLFKNRININLQDYKGNTALHYSVMYCYLNTIDSFLWYGADPNIVNNDGETPLHLSIRFRLLETTKILLTSNKINLHMVDQNGNTLLHLFASMERTSACFEYSSVSSTELKINEFFELMEKTLSNTIDPNLKNNDGWTAFDIAMKQKDSIIMDYLFAVTDFDVKNLNEDGQTYLHIAALRNDPDLLDFILAKYPSIDINKKDNYGKTALDILLDLHKQISDMIETVKQS